MKRPGTLRFRTPLAVALGLSTVLALTGCGESHPSDGSEAAEDRQSVTVPTSPTTMTSRRPDSQERTLPPKCREGDPLAVGRAPLDPGLGHRYLRIDVRNCTSGPLDLDRPIITGVTGTGRTGTLRLIPTPVANRPEEPFTLAPGDTAHAGVEWLAEPRTRRIQELRVAATNGDIPDLVPLEVLEMRLSTSLDYYPWVSNPDDVF